jgi:hypothetical protein
MLKKLQVKMKNKLRFLDFWIFGNAALWKSSNNRIIQQSNNPKMK